MYGGLILFPLKVEKHFRGGHLPCLVFYLVKMAPWTDTHIPSSCEMMFSFCSWSVRSPCPGKVSFSFLCSKHLTTWRMLSHFTFEAQLPESAGSQRPALTPWSFIWPLCNLRKRKLQADEPQGVAAIDLLRSSPSVALIDGFLKESLILTQTCKCVSLVLWNWLSFASRVISHPGTKYQFSMFLFYSNCGFSIVLWEAPRYIFPLHLTKEKRMTPKRADETSRVGPSSGDWNSQIP